MLCNYICNFIFCLGKKFWNCQIGGIPRPTDYRNSISICYHSIIYNLNIKRNITNYIGVFGLVKESLSWFKCNIRKKIDIQKRLKDMTRKCPVSLV